jgi:hypothetical protein
VSAIEYVNAVLLMIVVVFVIDISQKTIRMEKLVRQLLASVVTFEPGEEFDPEPPKGPEARIGNVAFVRKTPMRRTVRRYTLEEDANNPLQD